MLIVNDIIERSVYLKNIANKTLEIISSKYSAEAQVSITKTVGLNVSSRHGNLHNIEFNNDNVLEITVFYKKRKGVIISSDLKEKNIPKLISKAISIAHHTSPDECSGLASKLLLSYQDLDLDLFHPIEYSIEHIINLVIKTEQIALKYDKNIIHTEGANFSSRATTKILANTHGMLQSYNSTQYLLTCGVVAIGENDNMERDHSYTINRSFNNLRSPKQIGQESAKRTIKKLNAKKIHTIESPILFSAEMATSLFNHLLNAIHGKNIYKKSTFLLHDLGKMIFPSWLSIKECPHVPAEIASSPFDDEGVKSTDRIIVKNGMLCTWLLDSYSSRKIGLCSTGHANNIYNWYISHNDINFTSLIQEINKGVFITDLMGQGVNLITGDYSRGASGFWIEHGEIQFPISEITISGNLKQMFSNIVSIGNDIETRSNIKCGSTLISSIKIAGK